MAESVSPFSHVLEFGKADFADVRSANAPAAMYFVISVLPISTTSGTVPPAKVLVLGVALVQMPLVTRIVRTATLEQSVRGFVEAAVALDDSAAAIGWSEAGLRRFAEERHPVFLAPLLAATATAHLRADPPRPADAGTLLAHAQALVAALPARGTLAEAEVATSAARPRSARRRRACS